MRMKNTVLLGCLLSCASFAASAQTSVDRSFTAVQKNCEGIQWSEEAKARYPGIADACQSVEERNGKTYVKFKGEVVNSLRNGEMTVNFEGAGKMVLTPPPDMQINIDGRQTPVARLNRGDELTMYVSEDRLAAQFPADETPTAKLVVVPIMVRETPPPQEEQTASLPSTAGDLPLIGLLGALAIALGGALTLRRKG